MRGNKSDFSSIYDQKFYNSVGVRGEKVAEITLKLINRIAPIHSITDLGTGAGTWILQCATSFPSANLHAYDLESCGFNSNPKKTNRITFTPVDFENLKSGSLVSTDLSICLEVFEHLSPSACVLLLDEMCKNSKYILFSAAVPGQGGTNHINERPHEYWISMFLDHGYYCFDLVRPHIQLAQLPSYYRNNIFFFVKKENAAELLRGDNFPEILSVTHPPDYRSIRSRFISYILMNVNPKIVTLLAKIKDLF
jgi:hypothetical protein